MKKLFLYLLIAVALFSTFYLILYDYFDNSMKKNQNLKEDAAIEISAGYTKDTDEVITDNDSKTERETNKGSKEKTDNSVVSESEPAKEELSASFENSDRYSNYIVTICNDYVIVYYNRIGNVFEYTDVSAFDIKRSDENLYNRLLGGIIFENKMELFDFLESVSS